MNPPRTLSLPEEFLLLSQRQDGEPRHEVATAYGCAAAEIGELVLRGAIRVRHKEVRIFGSAMFIGSGKVELLDSASTGVPWAEQVRTGLAQRRAARAKPIALSSWVRHRGSEALIQHRSALLARSLLSQAPPTTRRGPDRFLPHPVAREALLTEMRAILTGQHPADEHSFLLYQLSTGDLLDREVWQGINRWTHRGVNPFAALSKDLFHAGTAIKAAIPSSSGSGGGGDGDGGE